LLLESTVIAGSLVSPTEMFSVPLLNLALAGSAMAWRAILLLVARLLTWIW